VYNDEPTRFIASSDHGLIFHIDKTPANARYWDIVDHAMNVKRLSVEFCYCPVSDECWSVKGQVREEVKACVPDPHLEFVPKPRAQIVQARGERRHASSIPCGVRPHSVPTPSPLRPRLLVDHFTPSTVKSSDM
jgi:hypothetical protein